MATSSILSWEIPWTEEPGSRQFSLVQLSHSVMSDSLRPHGLQQARLPCPSPTPGVYSDSCPLSRWCHPTISSSVYPFSSRLQKTSLRVFSNESALHLKWPKYWNFSINISPSNEYSGLISFRMDWLDLLAVQRTLKSPLQHHSSKASILLRSAFFIVQLSHPYMTPGKTIALTRWTFVGKVMSLLFNMLSRLVITFLPRCKSLLIYSMKRQKDAYSSWGRKELDTIFWLYNNKRGGESEMKPHKRPAWRCSVMLDTLCIMVSILAVILEFCGMLSLGKLDKGHMSFLCMISYNYLKSTSISK